MRTHYTLKTASDTQKLAENLAQTLHGGEVIGLIGDLGTGKTTFAQYLAAALGVKKTVISPTFTIMQTYHATYDGITRFIHIDAYRLSFADDLRALGVEEYFNDPTTVTVVEWADRTRDIFPAKSVLLTFSTSGTNRAVTLHYTK